jgi:hypothetical protein
MYRVCIEKTTGKLIEMQSGDGDLESLKQNAINQGYTENDIELKTITSDEWKVIEMKINRPTPKIELVKTDTGMARVIEDLIDLLVAKRAIKFDELPMAAQDKIATRKSLRNT